MSAVPKLKLTPAEYLARERKAEYKSEYYAGEIFAMSGASREHNDISENLSAELRNRLRASKCGCRSYSRDMRVKVSPTGLYTYPDYIIYCGEPEFEDAELDTLLNPQVIIEVLSESTANYDRGAKFQQYESIASLREYVLIDQYQPFIERYVRQPDSSWLRTTITGLDAEFAFATVSVSIPMAEVYDNVTFPETPPR